MLTIPAAIGRALPPQPVSIGSGVLSWGSSVHGWHVVRAVLAACVVGLVSSLAVTATAIAADPMPSRWGHSGETAAQALETARANFRGAVTPRARKAPGANVGERVARYLDANTVQLELGESRRPVVVESMQPLRGSDSAGKKVPLDLAIRQVSGRWRPEAPAVPLTFATDVADGARLDALGLSVVPVLPSSPEPQLAGESLFWGNVAADTDWLERATAGGVETFAQLRSPDSPEAFSVRIQSTDGPVQLERQAPPLNDPVAATALTPIKVIVADKAVARVLPPTATDASGQPVPVTYTLNDNELTMRIAHRDAAVTYPVLLDPQVEDFNVSSTQGWFSNATTSAMTMFDGGSYLAIQPQGLGVGNYYTATDAAAWEYQAGRGLVNDPGTSTNSAYIFQGYTEMGCCYYADAEMFDSTVTGGWTTGNVGGYPYPGNPGAGWQGYYRVIPYEDEPPTTGLSEPHRRLQGQDSHVTAGDRWVQHCPYALCTPESANPDAYRGNKLIWGVRFTDHEEPHGSNIYATLSGAQVYLDDGEAPRITSGEPPDVGWTDHAELSASASAQDDASPQTGVTVRGLGVRELRLTGPAESGDTFSRSSLAPVEGQSDITNSCTGTFSKKCRQSWDFAANPISYSTDELAEGDNAMALTAFDAPGKPSTATEFHVEVDRTAPDIALSGSLYDSRDQTVTGSSYDLTVTATDGSTSAASTERSGVRTVTIYVDGERAYHHEQSCVSSCPWTTTYTFRPGEHQGGQHTVEVDADDQLGHASEQTFVVTTGCCSGSPSSWGSTSPTVDVVYGDVNGDGAADLVTRDQLTGDVMVGISNHANGFEPAASWGNWPTTRDVRVADVTGDGYGDLVGRDTLNGNLVIGPSTGANFATGTAWTTIAGDDDYLFGDVDGDDGDDLVTRNRTTGAVSVAASRGDGFDPATVWTTWAPTIPMYLGDATGDGAFDLIARDGSNGAIQVGESTTSAFAPASTWGSVSGSGDFAVADMNGDGSDDAVYRDPSTGEVSVLASSGSAFGNSTHWGSFPVDHDFHTPDSDGDGEQDVIGRSAAGDITAMLSNVVPPVVAAPTYAPDPSLPYDTTDPLGPDDDSGSGTRATAASSQPVMRLGWADNAQLVDWYVDHPTDDATFDRSANRIGQSGGHVIRMLVYWENWSDPRYVSALDRAVARAISQGFVVMFTVTGSNLSNSTTGTDPSPAAFGSWVSDVVSHFDPLGVHLYAMWNEPNNSRFLSVPCGPADPASHNYHDDRDSTERYRSLYLEGYAAVKAVNHADRVYLGELSEHAQSRHTSCAQGAPKKSLATDAFLDAVVTTQPQDLIATSGISWHPYQHYYDPRDTSRRRGMGIGNIKRMHDDVDELFRAGKIATALGKVPSLYLTEFGYLNRPDKPNQPSSAYHTEKERASWYPRALELGRKNGARMFLLYQTVEATPASPLATDFDTGMIGPSGQVTGQRSYGKGPNPDFTQNTQDREAYCSVWQWAATPGYGYTTSPAGC